MVNVRSCDDCIHAVVCGKKDTYEKFIDAGMNLAALPSETSVWFAKDCDYVLVDIECRHFARKTTSVMES